MYEIGGAVVQVSQPRMPCWKLNRRWHRKDMLKRVVATGRSGWYLRVLQEGRVEAGQAVTLIERPHPGWTIAYLVHLLRRPDEGLDVKAHLAACEHLSPGWREDFAAQVEKF